MSKKKKILIIILAVVAIYIVTTIPYRIIKGNKVFGRELCTEISQPANYKPGLIDKHSNIGGTSITKWSCDICGWHGTSGTTATPTICELCAFITNRCEDCGGKLK